MNHIGSLEPRERKLGGGRKKNNREKCYQEKGLRRGRIIREIMKGETDMNES